MDGVHSLVVVLCALAPCLGRPSQFRRGLPVALQTWEGDTVELPCQVEEVGNGTVSWLRHQPLAILSAGRYTFTTDPRFTADYRRKEDTWVLRIRRVRAGDAGEYECQLSGEPVLSHGLRLAVLTRPVEAVEVVSAEASALQQEPARERNRGGDAGGPGGDGGGPGGSLAVAAACLTLALLCLAGLGALRSLPGGGPEVTVAGPRPPGRGGAGGGRRGGPRPGRGETASFRPGGGRRATPGETASDSKPPGYPARCPGKQSKLTEIDMEN